MHLSRYLSGTLLSLPALLSNSAQPVNTNKTDALGSSPNRLLPRGGSGRSTSSSSNRYGGLFSSSSILRTASISSRGGGSPLRLGSNSRFPGRWAGGGGRGSIYGTSRFGSGSHGTGAPMCMEDADFVFGFWPIWFPDGYCGTNAYEYPSTRFNDTRPGGEVVVVDVQPNSTDFQVSAEEKNHTYYMFGDKDSIVLMMGILSLPNHQGGCSVLNANPANWTLSTVAKDRFEPGHVLQWYRSNSFALAYTGYNNSYAYPPLNTTSPVNMSDPLPSALLISSYLSCLNKTIGDDLPIMDAEKTLPAMQIAAIVICSVIGLIVLILICCQCRSANLCSSGLWRRRERKDTNPNIRPTIGHGSSKSDITLAGLPSYRSSTTSNRRSSLASTFSLSPTLNITSTPASPTLGRNPSGLPSYSREPDKGTSGASRTSPGHQHNNLLAVPLSPHFSGHDRSSRMSVSSESSQGRSRSPSPF